MRATIAICLSVLLAAPVALAARGWSPAEEKRVGAEAAAQVEAEYKRYEDPEVTAKLTEMVSIIAAASSRPDVTYEVRLLDTDIVNGFSLPGGIIYVTKGLLNEVQSDHELAGVLAHEIAHNCTYDALRQAESHKKLFMGSTAATIAAILLGATTDTISTVLLAGDLITRGVLGGYSVAMERNADAHAVEYLLKTPYNPVGLLTFMERLAADWRAGPQIDPGYERTHPDPPVRVQELAERLYRAGVDINPRATTQWERPKAEEVEVDGQKVVRVVLWGEEIFRVLTPGPEAETPMARAEAIVARLTALLEAGMQRFEIEVGDNGGNPAVMGRGEVILTVYPEDAAAQGVEQAALAEQAHLALRLALRIEQLGYYW
ncbi:MAG: M48 family metalloprotease [Armatimonadota bacterium]